MKKINGSLRILLLSCLLLPAYPVLAQTYPEPEFANEIYFLGKDNGNKLVRLEKGSSKMDTKTKMGGFGGSESGYSIDGSKSQVRLGAEANLSFVISNGASNSSSGESNSSRSDSVMRANGIDPAMMKMTGDPSQTITLYKLDIEKGDRKVLLQKIPGANPFGSHKMQSSDKYTFSAKKIRDGYWELVVDKPLPKGEYAFTMMDTGISSMSGGTLFFAFGID
ncbi:MAG TPA: hypothetical protein VGI82_10140 [Chitinophagaceae bacterium]|jgi:hypothetical protein